MYKTRIGLYSLDTTFTRPVIIKAVENTIRYLGLNKNIYYTLDDNDKVDREKDKLGKIDSYSSPRSEHIVIDYEEEISDDYDVSIKMLHPNSKPIYIDNDLKTKFIPVYSKRKYTIDFEYRNKSKSKVTNLINRLRTMVARDGQYIVNHMEYSYVLPTYAFMLVKEINDKKNLALNTNVDIETYINDHFDLRVDTINPTDGDSLKTDVVIREKQQNIISKITTNLADIKKEHIEDEESWSIKFSYVFEIEQPTELILYYPMTIYGKLIDEKFRTFIKQDEFVFKGEEMKGDRALTDIGVRREFANIVNKLNKPYINIPFEDTVELPKAKPDMTRIVSVMTSVNPNDTKELFNIMDIPILQFNQVVLDYFKEEGYKNIGIPYKTLFYIELYKEDRLNDSNVITMDTNLNLRTTLDLDPKYMYRVTINILNDINLLRGSDLLELKKYIANKYMSDPEIPTIVDLYKHVLNIPEQYLRVHKKDYSIDIDISNNKWNTMKTVQVMDILTYMFKPKES